MATPKNGYPVSYEQRETPAFQAVRKAVRAYNLEAQESQYTKGAKKLFIIPVERFDHEVRKMYSCMQDSNMTPGQIQAAAEGKHVEAFYKANQKRHGLTGHDISIKADTMRDIAATWAERNMPEAAQNLSQPEYTEVSQPPGKLANHSVGEYTEKS